MSNVFIAVVPNVLSRRAKRVRFRLSCTHTPARLHRMNHIVNERTDQPQMLAPASGSKEMIDADR